MARQTPGLLSWAAYGPDPAAQGGLGAGMGVCGGCDRETAGVSAECAMQVTAAGTLKLCVAHLPHLLLLLLLTVLCIGSTRNLGHSPVSAGGVQQRSVREVCAAAAAPEVFVS